MQADDVGVFLVEKGEEREGVGVARGRVVVVASGEAVELKVMMRRTSSPGVFSMLPPI